MSVERIMWYKHPMWLFILIQQIKAAKICPGQNSYNLFTTRLMSDWITQSTRKYFSPQPSQVQTSANDIIQNQILMVASHNLRTPLRPPLHILFLSRSEATHLTCISQTTPETDQVKQVRWWYICSSKKLLFPRTIETNAYKYIQTNIRFVHGSVFKKRVYHYDLSDLEDCFIFIDFH
jgi:hypothetical protein